MVARWSTAFTSASSPPWTQTNSAASDALQAGVASQNSQGEPHAYGLLRGGRAEFADDRRSHATQLRLDALTLARSDQFIENGRNRATFRGNRRRYIGKHFGYAQNKRLEDLADDFQFAFLAKRLRVQRQALRHASRQIQPAGGQMLGHAASGLAVGIFMETHRDVQESKQRIREVGPQAASPWRHSYPNRSQAACAGMSRAARSIPAPL
jgi:hypothetical protein